jgi:hypothetical protein
MVYKMNKKILAFLAMSIFSIGTALACCQLATEFLQVGNEASESTHNLVGWGPIEPDTAGGNWGGMGSGLEPNPSDNKCRVTWATYEPDTNEGRSAYITLNIPEKCGKDCDKNCGKPAKTLVLRVLDGQADDNFIVFVECEKPKKDSTFLIYEFNADPSTAEVWKTHEIDLTSLPNWCRVKPMTFRIMATGNAWQSKSTYGQLAIDYAELK